MFIKSTFKGLKHTAHSAEVPVCDHANRVMHVVTLPGQGTTTGGFQKQQQWSDRRAPQALLCSGIRNLLPLRPEQHLLPCGSLGSAPSSFASAAANFQIHHYPSAGNHIWPEGHDELPAWSQGQKVSSAFVKLPLTTKIAGLTATKMQKTVLYLLYQAEDRSLTSNM